MKKKGFILVELLVSLIVSGIVLSMIFSLYHFFNTVDQDGVDAARFNHSIHTIKETILENSDEEFWIDDYKLCYKEDDEVISYALASTGTIEYYEEDGFQKCKLIYGNEIIDFVVKELD